MKNSKKTKRAFLFSVLSVVLCIAMLAGTTFAWFTDSVSTANNIIKSGNLDVQLLKENGDEVLAEDKLFSEEYWEPGHVEVVPLTVKNAGSLALKYKLKITKTKETGSTNVYEQGFKVSNYIQYAIIEGTKTYGDTPEDRAQAIKDAEAANPTPLTSIAYVKDGVLYEQNETAPLTLIAYMPTTVGNEANYKTGEKVPTITLGVNLVATQVEHESDSFGDDYDASAPNLDTIAFVDTRSEINSKMSSKNVTDIVVEADVADALRITDGITGNSDKNVAFGDNTLTFKQEGGFLFRNGTKTITLTGGKGGIVAPHEVIWNSKETVTVNIISGNYKATAEGDGVEVIYCEKGTVNISGGFFETPGNKAPTFLLNCKDANRAAGTAKIVVTGGTFVNFDPSNNTAEGANTNFVAEGYTVKSATQKNGDVWYTVVKA